MLFVVVVYCVRRGVNRRLLLCVVDVLVGLSFVCAFAWSLVAGCLLVFLDVVACCCCVFWGVCVVCCCVVVVVCVGVVRRCCSSLLFVVVVRWLLLAWCCWLLLLVVVCCCALCVDVYRSLMLLLVSLHADVVVVCCRACYLFLFW